MICICVTIVIVAIIILLGYYLYLIKCNPTKIQIDDNIYKDRLLIIKDKYKEVKADYDIEDEDISIGVRELMVLIEAAINRVY